jgi:hypothetical protein
VGEKLTYQIFWGPLVVGRATLEVQGIEKIDGHDCYYLTGQAKTTGLADVLYPVNSKTESWLDVEGLFSRKFRQDRTEGTHHRADETSYDYNRKELVIKTPAKQNEKRFPLAQPVQDVISCIYYMRTQPLKLHNKTTFVINNGNTNYDVSVSPDQRKSLWVRPVGEVQALRFEPNPTLKIVASNKGRMWFWVSDDLRRLPLIVATDMKIGSAKLVLFKVETSNPAADKAQRAKAASPDGKITESTPTLAAGN